MHKHKANLQEFLDKVPVYTKITFVKQENTGEIDVAGCPIPKRIVITISFGETGFGFGEIAIIQDEAGQVFLDTESMSKKTVLHLLGRLIEGAIDDRDEDPERHRKYNEVMQRTCGDSCKVCNP